jgi:hypothetical protein
LKKELEDYVEDLKNLQEVWNFSLLQTR